MTASTGTPATTPRLSGVPRLRMLLDAMVATIGVVVAASDRHALLDGACRALVVSGPFEMVWIGADESGAGWLERLAVAGDRAHYTDGIRVATTDVAEGRGPTGTAARTGRPFICRDVALDARMLPWREQLARAGFKSSAAFPLHSQSLPSAVLTVYAAVPGAFDREEAGVLERLADAIGLALDALAGRAEREQALQARSASEERYRLLIESAVDGILVSDATGRYVEANPAMCRMLGYTRDEILARSSPSLSAADDPLTPEEMDDLLEADRHGTGFVVERHYRRKDGTSLVAEASIIELPGGGLLREIRDIGPRRAAEAAQALETSLRDRLARTIAGIREDATTADVTRAFVAELGSLPGIGYAAVFGYVHGSEATVLVCQAADAMPPPDQHTRLTRALRDTSRRGPWAMAWSPSPDDGALGRALRAAGFLGIAFAPIVHGDHADGVVVLASAEPRTAKTLVAHMAKFGDFTNTASALLAQRLHDGRVLIEARGAIQLVIDRRAFRPAFQPIVDLETRQVVGYEALTRFDGGERPDQVFARARTVGLGPDLELTTLAAALEASQHLPAGRWLDVNVTPSLLIESREPLGSVLAAADRPLVLEVTEHELIADYEALRDAVSRLGVDVRLAVDDAGAGIANFGHILELRAEFVKLDISLVRGINAALGRQALVVGMRHFSRSTGCRLVAEGVETEQEAATLVQLGVEYGQGYLFGRPEPWERVAPPPGHSPAASRRRKAADPSPARATRPATPGVDRARRGPDARTSAARTSG